MMTYENALAAFCNQVNHKFPPELSYSNSRRTRIINKSVNSGGGRGSIFQGQGGIYQRCAVRGGFGGLVRGRVGLDNRVRGNYMRSRQDSLMVQCNDVS